MRKIIKNIHEYSLHLHIFIVSWLFMVNCVFCNKYNIAIDTRLFKYLFRLLSKNVQIQFRNERRLRWLPWRFVMSWDIFYELCHHAICVNLILIIYVSCFYSFYLRNAIIILWRVFIIISGYNTKIGILIFIKSFLSKV